MAKAASLLLDAEALRAGTSWPRLALFAGLAAGSVKAWLLFRPVCHRNLARIATLERPRIWQFYRLRFYVFLALMISAGSLLSRWAHGDFWPSIGVALLDLSVGTALLASSYVYWTRRAFIR